jgi:hypothetical protein
MESNGKIARRNCTYLESSVRLGHMERIFERYTRLSRASNNSAMGPFAGGVRPTGMYDVSIHMKNQYDFER